MPLAYVARNAVYWAAVKVSIPEDAIRDASRLVEPPHLDESRSQRLGSPGGLLDVHPNQVVNPKFKGFRGVHVSG